MARARSRWCGDLLRSTWEEHLQEDLPDSSVAALADFNQVTCAIVGLLERNPFEQRGYAESVELIREEGKKVGDKPIILLSNMLREVSFWDELIKSFVATRLKLQVHHGRVKSIESFLAKEKVVTKKNAAEMVGETSSIINELGTLLSEMDPEHLKKFSDGILNALLEFWKGLQPLLSSEAGSDISLESVQVMVSDAAVLFPLRYEFPDMQLQLTKMLFARAGEQKMRDVLEGVEVFTQVVKCGEHIKDTELAAVLSKIEKAKGLSIAEKEEKALKERCVELLNSFHGVLASSQSEALKLLSLIKGLVSWQCKETQSCINRIGAEVELMQSLQEYTMNPEMEVDIAKMIQQDGAFKRMGRLMRAITKAEGFKSSAKGPGVEHFEKLMKEAVDIQVKVKGVLLAQAKQKLEEDIPKLAGLAGGMADGTSWRKDIVDENDWASVHKCGKRLLQEDSPAQGALETEMQSLLLVSLSVERERGS